MLYSGEIAEEAARNRLDRQEYDYFFIGLDLEVLLYIRTFDWNALLAYYADDPGHAIEDVSQRSRDVLTSDGLLFQYTVSEEDSEYIREAIANAVQNVFGPPPATVA